LEYKIYKMAQPNHEMELKPFSVEAQIFAGPGPTNISPRVRLALSIDCQNPIWHNGLKLIMECRELLKQAFLTKNKLTFGHLSSGSGGLELAVVNLVSPGQCLVVCVAGTWGERVAEIGDRNGCKVVRLTVPDGEVYTHETIEAALIKHKPVMVFMTHGETSTGVLQPLEGMGDLCHKYNSLLGIDAIITFGAERLLVDEWKIDVAVGASQKALAMPPGMSYLTFSERAEKVINTRETDVGFYVDVKNMAHMWGCYSTFPGYHYTLSCSMLAATREALMQLMEEGMENVWERHRKVGEHMWQNMEAIGFPHWVKKRENRLHCVGVYNLPSDAQGEKNMFLFLNALFEKYKIFVAHGIGPTSGTSIRVGLMNLNASQLMADHVASCIKKCYIYYKENRNNLKLPEIMCTGGCQRNFF